MGDKGEEVPARYVLITNLDGVVVNGVRTFSHALLLQDDGVGRHTFGGPRFRARGFGYDASSPTFDCVLPSIDYTIALAESPHRWFGDSGVEKPLSRGGIMTVRAPLAEVERKIPDVVMELHADIGNDLPLDEQHLERPSDDKSGRWFTEKLWRILDAKIVHYWHAPFFLMRQQVPIDQIRRALEVEGVRR